MFFLQLFFFLSNIDSAALSLALVGYVVVFLVLVIMISIYLSLPKLLNIGKKRPITLDKKGKKQKENVTGEVSAAISTALYLHLAQMHDIESDVVTIKTINKRYSPWSAKANTLNTYFNKK